MRKSYLSQGLSLWLALVLVAAAAPTNQANDRTAVGAAPIWTYDSDLNVRHIESADLNGDDIPDVIAGEYSNDYYGDPSLVLAIDGLTGDTLWTYLLDDGVRCMTIGDITDDGVPDVIAGATYHTGDVADGRVHALNGVTGSLLWTFSTGASHQDVCVGNFDGDQYGDVAVASFDDNIYTIGGETGNEIWHRTIGSMWVNALAAADVNDDGIDDVAYAHEYLAGWDNYIGVLNGTNGHTIWSDTLQAVALDVLVEDFDNDNALEIAFATISSTDQGEVAVRDALTGAIEWSVGMGVIDHTNGEMCLFAHDIDNDNDPDLVLGNSLGWRYIYVFDGTTSTPIYVSDSLTAFPRDCAFGDPDGDGELDIVIAAYDAVQVVSAKTGAAKWSYNVDGGIYSVAVGDFDDDGVDDVAAGGNGENAGWPPDPGKTVWALKTVESPLWWEFGFGEYGNGMAVDDINDDSFDDVLAVASVDDWVWAIDGKTGEPLWSWTGTENLYAVTSGDFDNDGQVDVAVAGNDDMVTAINGADGSPMWQFTTPGDQVYRKCLAATDVNGDDALDVIAGADDGYIYAIDGPSGTTIWAQSFAGDAEDVQLAQMNNSGPLDVVAIVGQKLAVLDGADGSLLWDYADGTSSVKHVTVLDANDDEVLDCAIGIGDAGLVTVVDGLSHLALWTRSPVPLGSDYCLAHGRLNEDKADDVVAGGDYNDRRVWALDGLTGDTLWTFLTGGEINAVACADVNGDELVDVLVGSDDGHMYALEGSTGVPFFDYATTGDVMHVGVGDISGDGALNMSCVTFDSDGRVYAFNSLYTVDQSCCRGMTGNINGDPTDILDVSDLVYLVNYMFQGGPEPYCMLEVNLDGLGNPPVDIADLVYLVNYMFSSGPAPVPCE